MERKLTSSLIGALWAWAIVCSTAGAWAETGEPAKHYRLRWLREGGAETCVSGAALERLLDQVLEPHAANATPSLLLEGVARPAEPPLKFELDVVVRDPQSGEIVGERTLTSVDGSCAALTPALLLVLAMSIDPEAGRDGLPPTVTEQLRREREAAELEAPKVVTTPRAGVSPQAPSAALPPPLPPAKPLQLAEPRVFGTLGVTAGILPRLASGAELGGRIPLRRGWSVSVSVHGWLPQVVALEPSAYLLADGIQLAAGALGAGLCRPLLEQRLELSLCGGFGVGLRWVAAHALGKQANPAHLFYGPSLGLDASWRVHPSWFVSAGLAAQARLARERFTYTDHLQQPHVWYDPPLLAGRLWLGLGAYL